jgi:phospholipid/cholesterol/gamma-HCH transport system ATP-binding protein
METSAMPQKTDQDDHIVARDLTMAYGDFIIQHDLNFTVRRGDIFIVMGGSGCGKSTLLRHMIGLKSPARGRVLFDGVSYWESSPTEQQRIKRGFGVSFQSGALWSSLTLSENVALPLGEYTDLAPADITEVVSLKLSLVGLASPRPDWTRSVHDDSMT